MPSLFVRCGNEVKTIPFSTAKLFRAFLRGSKHTLVEFRPSHNNLTKSQQLYAIRAGRAGSQDLDASGYSS